MVQLKKVVCRCINCNRFGKKKLLNPYVFKIYLKICVCDLYYGMAPCNPLYNISILINIVYNNV